MNIEILLEWFLLLLVAGTNKRFCDLPSPPVSLVTFRMLGSGCLKVTRKNSPWKTAVGYRTASLLQDGLAINVWFLFLFIYLF